MGSYCTGGRGGAFLCSIRNSCTRNTGTNAKITFLSNDSRYPKCLLEGSPASPALTYDNSSIKKTTSVDHRSSDIERWKPIYSEKKKSVPVPLCPTRMVKAIHSWKPIWKRPTGRPKIRWEDDVKKDIQKLEMPNWKTFVQDRRRWKELVEKARNLQ